MNLQNVSYRALQSSAKTARDKFGYEMPKLNAKKDILIAALQDAIAKGFVIQSETLAQTVAPKKASKKAKKVADISDEKKAEINAFIRGIKDSTSVLAPKVYPSCLLSDRLEHLVASGMAIQSCQWVDPRIVASNAADHVGAVYKSAEEIAMLERVVPSATAIAVPAIQTMFATVRTVVDIVTVAVEDAISDNKAIARPLVKAPKGKGVKRQAIRRAASQLAHIKALWTEATSPKTVIPFNPRYVACVRNAAIAAIVR